MNTPSNATTRNNNGVLHSQMLAQRLFIHQMDKLREQRSVRIAAKSSPYSSISVSHNSPASSTSSLNDGQQLCLAHNSRFSALRTKIIMTKTLNKSLSTVEQQTSTTSTTTRHPFNINPDFSPIYPVGSQTFIPTLPPVPTEALEIDMDALDVGRLLQCPICLDLCIPPIYQFNNCLHTICSECQSKVHLCPVCRGNGLEFSRNRVLESLYNATKFACKYKNQGCTEVVRGDKFSDHVQYCQNKDLPCTFGGDLYSCSKKRLSMQQPLTLSKLVLHFINDHEIPKKDSGSYCIHSAHLKPGTQLPLTVLEFDGKTFLEIMLVTENHFFFNVLLLGEKRDAIKYTADLRLVRPSIPGIDSSIVNFQSCNVIPLPVRSILIPPDELKNLSFGFPIPLFYSKILKLGSSTKHYWMTRVDIKIKPE